MQFIKAFVSLSHAWLTLADTRHFIFASKDFNLLGFLTLFDYEYTST